MCNVHISSTQNLFFFFFLLVSLTMYISQPKIMKAVENTQNKQEVEKKSPVQDLLTYQSIPRTLL